MSPEALKHGAFINERSYPQLNARPASELLDYWKKYFSDDGELLDGALHTLSNINSDHLSSLYEEDYSPDVDDEWVRLSRELFEQSWKRVTLPEPLEQTSEKQVPFFNFFKPFLKLALLELTRSLGSKDLNRSLLEAPLYQLTQTLFQISHKTLILELNVARVSDQLQGETSEEGYTYYTETLINDSAYINSFYTEYPTLVRLLLTKVGYWAVHVSEILTRVKEDREALSDELNNGRDLGEVVHIGLGLGDAHHKGKGVALIAFEHGKVVYKPRSLAIDTRYHSFIHWLNRQHASKYDFYELKVVERKNYGWTEFISYNDCHSPEAIQRFYVRMGNLLALLYVLDAVDFHYENLIAHHEYPVPVDLEPLFHQAVHPSIQAVTAAEKATQVLERSVKSTGILPVQLYFAGNDENKGVDLSGLGGKDKQSSPFKVSQIVQRSSDRMKIEKDYFQMSAEKNNPKLDGKNVNTVDYLDAIKEGFQECYAWIAGNKAAVKEQLSSFFDVNARFILRPTNQYGRLMDQSCHPDFLRNSLARDIFLHRLYINTPEKNEFDRVVQSEKSEMLQGDIPYFYSKIGEPHLYLNDESRIDGYFEESAFERVMKKIDQLSSRDCEAQLNVIHMSILAGNARHDKENSEVKLSKPMDPSFLNEHFLKEAERIGEYILSKAITGKNGDETDYCWISTVVEGSDELRWRIIPAGLDLYNGNTGIALFFAYLGELTKREDFKQAGYTTLVSVRKAFDQLDADQPFSIGAFEGLGGCIYGLNQLAELWEDGSLRKAVNQSLEKLIARIPDAEESDVIGGLAGTLGIFLSVYETNGNLRALEGAERCAEKIINEAEHFGDGIAWRSTVTNHPYTGFAHGTSGIAAMLGRLYAITGRRSLHKAIQQTLTFDRQNYVESEKNWRKKRGEDDFNVAWCHGAPGILLSRLMLKRDGYHDPELDIEIEQALETTLDAGFGNNHSLCHGDFGQIEILETAAEILNDDDLKTKARSAAQQVFKTIQTKGWDRGSSRGAETFGLMIGLAGYGYGMLNQYAPDCLPSIMKLQNPISIQASAGI